jgi:asparagine synthase (glutamine-hydrolysing)
MSGICAVWRRDRWDRTGATVASIGRGLSLAGSERFEQEIESACGVAASILFDQQIYRSDGVCLACDADLENRRELMREAGVQDVASSNAGTAAMLAALYERYGPRFVEKLRGAFAVIVWDRRRNQLFAAVDHFGIKRLVYHQNQAALLVSSRIDALLRSGEVAAEINPAAVANLVNFSIIPGPETIFTQVRRIPPGSLLVASDQHTRVEKYWDMQYEIDSNSGEDRLSRELESLVEQAVARRCQDESPDTVGAFLSGGTDSSTIVGMMSRLNPGNVRAFSIGFREQPFDELHYADIAAKRFQANHHIYRVSPEDCFDALPDMIRYFDEPFGNSSAIPTYFCLRLAAQQGVKLMLAGDGGDELFGGNEAYRAEKVFELYQALPMPLRKGVIEPVLAALPLKNGVVGKARRYVGRSNMPRVQRMLSSHFLSTHPLGEVFEPDFLKELGSFSVLDGVDRHYSQAPAKHPLNRRMYADVKTVLGDSDLPKVTRMCELAGVRPRFPFLDLSVAEFSGRIPPSLKVKGLEKRYLFKRAFRNLLPIEIIQKKKHGFGIPVALWMKSDPRLRELSHDVLLSNRTFERGYFRRAFFEELFRQYEADSSTFYGDVLWNFLILELWHRQFVDEPARATA